LCMEAESSGNAVQMQSMKLLWEALLMTENDGKNAIIIHFEPM